MNEMILLKLGEMVLKGLNRRSFEDKLQANIHRRLKDLGQFKVYTRQSTTYVEPKDDSCDMDTAYERMKKVFGVVGVSRARAFAQKLHMQLAIVDKRRQKANQCEVMNVIGDVAGKACILFDDMVDTAGSLCNAAKAIADKGATAVYACATHPVLSGPAIQRITDSVITEMVFLNTIPATEAALACPKIKYLDVAPMFAEAIQRTYDEASLSPMF